MWQHAQGVIKMLHGFIGNLIIFSQVKNIKNLLRYDSYHQL